MIKKEGGGFTWLEFSQLQPFPHLIHGVFTKDNGDFKAQGVDAVRKFFGLRAMPCCRQVHGDKIVMIGAFPPSFVGEYDGAMTKERGVGLPILHADCQAAIFFDPKQNIIANIHSGWRGNVHNIYKKTVDTFVGLGSSARDLLVCISPSLGPKKAAFVNRELSPQFDAFETFENHFDLWAIAEAQLKGAGVEKIEIAKRCTYTEEDNFFSYRRGKDRERNMTFVALI